MGVISSNAKDLYSKHFITAEITDSRNLIHHVPIKAQLGDYFVAVIDGELYAFTMKNARILTKRILPNRAYQVIQYDTCHYSSLQPEIKELELILTKNGLPKMDGMLHDVLRVLGRREKDGAKFKPTDIAELVAMFAEQAGQYPEEVRNIQAYLQELDVDKIVTPVRKVTDFIQNDLRTTMPSFLGEMIPRYQRVDVEHKRITNTPIKGGKNIMKIVIIALIGIVGVAMIYIAAEEGMFDGISEFGSNIGTIQEGFQGLPSPTQGFQTGSSGGVDYSDASLQARYTPEGLKIAIENGEIDYNKLSSAMQAMVDSVELPQVVATP